MIVDLKEITTERPTPHLRHQEGEKGADQAKPAIEQAEQTKSTMDRMTQSAEDVAKKASQPAEQEK